MQIEPKQILIQFEGITKTALQNTFHSWYQYHQDKITELQTILDPLKINLVQTEDWTNTPEELWQEIESINQRMIKWIDSLNYFPADLQLDQLSQDWSEQFNSIEKILPEEIRILIGDTFWQSRPEDKLTIRIKKHYHKSKRWLHLRFLNLSNLGRRIIRKTPLKPEDIQHYIPLHNFLYSYLGLPFRQFIVAEWQRLLQAVSGQYFVLQMKSGELNNKILLLDKFPTIYNLEEKANIFDELYELAEILKNVDETLQVLTGYEKQFRARLDKIQAEVASHFQSAWNDARTFQISDKKYSGKKIKKIDLRQKVQFHKAVTLWYAHFHGLRQDWQKSLHIALLQFQSAHILRKIARTTGEKIRTVVDPAFREITTLVHDTESRFTTISSAKDLEKLIKAETEITVKSGLQTRLATLIDTIHQVQVIIDLQSFSEYISAHIQTFRKNYTIFLKRDTENSPPRSRLVEIPLQEIISAYIYADLISAHQPAINLAIDRQEKTLRSISEIDQILEHAFDTASNLIYQHGYDLDLQEPRAIIGDAFSRIKKILQSLNQEMDAIPREATTALVENLLEFENELQDLSATNKIHELKNRLERGRRPSRMKQRLSKIPDYLRQPLPLVRKKIFQNKSQSIAPKKITLLQEPIQIHSGSIGDFLRQTHSQISRLPFVYQRLFQSEPLTNQRFFSGRDLEMEIIQKEFLAWKNGTNTCLAIIGEAGSGKTSLLNFAESKMFSSHPLMKLDLQERVYSESRLSDFLKKKFNYPNASTLAEIEIRLMHEEETRICILENLHYMFLRVVNGLDALEKFLLLINRTQQKIFWIITCNYQAWRYLDKVLTITRNFPRILTLGNLPVQELKAILIKRHKISGFEIDFEIPKNWSKIRKIRKSSGHHHGQIKLLPEIFFEELNGLSAGNISIAILHWLRAINKFTKDKLILTPYVSFDYSFLNNLPEEDLFTLAAVLDHEMLTAADHARIFRQNQENSSIQITRLFNFGLLIASGPGFQVNPLLHRPLVNFLSSQNVLH